MAFRRSEKNWATNSMYTSSGTRAIYKPSDHRRSLANELELELDRNRQRKDCCTKRGNTVCAGCR
jgi:hypothetical protein